jgi:hypothetical protein
MHIDVSDLTILLLIFVKCRTFYNKCRENTPAAYLEQLRAADSEEVVLPACTSVLGDGVLRKEYEEVIALRRQVSSGQDAEQISQDEKLASDLLELERMEAEQRERDRRALAARDAEIAAKLACELVSPTKVAPAAAVSVTSAQNDKKRPSDRPAAGPSETAATSKKKRPVPETPSISKWLSLNSGQPSRPPLVARNSISPGNTMGAGGLTLSARPTSALVTAGAQTVSPRPSEAANKSIVESKLNWNCSMCTFENFFELSECEMCGVRRLLRRQCM